ncbi:hypothetical protein ACLOJK_031810 [Asimina triloba]
MGRGIISAEACRYHAPSRRCLSPSKTGAHLKRRGRTLRQRRSDLVSVSRRSPRGFSSPEAAARKCRSSQFLAMHAAAESPPSVFQSEIALLRVLFFFAANLSKLLPLSAAPVIVFGCVGRDPVRDGVDFRLSSPSCIEIIRCRFRWWPSCIVLVVQITVLMLLAVEGGGFFSSSASGYSKGLTLLLLGRRSEERPMRVSPWNQFQLLEQKDPDIQLASRKNRRFRGCAYFICFGRTSVGLDGSSPPKVGPARQSDGSQGTSSVSGSGQFSIADGGNHKNGRNVRLKSSLKKPFDRVNDVRCVLSEKENDDPSRCTERRKVQWTDACGGELVDVREFEPSPPTHIYFLVAKNLSLESSLLLVIEKGNDHKGQPRSQFKLGWSADHSLLWSAAWILFAMRHTCNIIHQMRELTLGTEDKGVMEEEMKYERGGSMKQANLTTSLKMKGAEAAHAGSSDLT